MVTTLTKPITSWAAQHGLDDVDLNKLDIKSNVTVAAPSQSMEDDLLADLEPTIAKGRGLLELLEEKVSAKADHKGPSVSKFSVEDSEGEGGWGDEADEGGWNTEWNDVGTDFPTPGSANKND